MLEVGAKARVVQEGQYQGMLVKVLQISFDDTGVLCRCEIIEPRGTYMIGDQFIVHRFELQEQEG